VLTADHGESLGEHGEETHAIFVYEATLHVPLILRYPRAWPAGVHFAPPVSSVDIMPTVLGAMGLSPRQAVQGRDLTPALVGKAPLEDVPLYSESKVSELGFGMAPLFALRVGPYTYIRAPEPELYDRSRDPNELTNLITSDAPRARQMDKLLGEVMAKSDKLLHVPAQNPVSQETLEMLRALGYLGDPDTKAAMGGMDPKHGIKIYHALERARHFAQVQRWADAIAALHAILADMPKHLSALNTLGFCLWRSGDDAAAEATYLASLAIDPKQSRVFHSLAQIDFGDGHLDAADAQEVRALALEPKFVEAMTLRGAIAARRGDLRGAEVWMQRALDVDPTYPRAAHFYADAFFEQQRYADALDYYERVLARTPRNFAVLLQAGVSQLQLGDDASAALYFSFAAAVRPDSWQPPYDLACASALSGDRQAALDFLEDALAKHAPPRRFVSHDADLASLHGEARFARIVGALPDRAEALE
jgi:tetratricopeptide (TPR) repeat protein